MEYLNAIGFWRGPGTRLLWPHPRELVDQTWPVEDRRRVVAYLRSGKYLTGYLGYSWCRFRNGPPDHEMGSADLTDGEWVWPEGLSVYVERYAVRLPELFLSAAAARFYTPPEVDVSRLEDVPYSFAMWSEWVRANRRNRVLAFLSRLVPRRKHRPPREPVVYEIE